MRSRIWVPVIALFVLVALATAHLDERRRQDERRGFPFAPDEHWDGYQTWTPERNFRQPWPMPLRFTVDRPGKCEVRCVRSGREYRCKEYRC
jgi:hypothetical protein